MLTSLCEKSVFVVIRWMKNSNRQRIGNFAKIINTFYDFISSNVKSIIDEIA